MLSRVTFAGQACRAGFLAAIVDEISAFPPRNASVVHGLSPNDASCDFDTTCSACCHRTTHFSTSATASYTSTEDDAPVLSETRLGVTHLTLNRPKRLNALSSEVCRKGRARQQLTLAHQGPPDPCAIRLSQCHIHENHTYARALVLEYAPDDVSSSCTSSCNARRPTARVEILLINTGRLGIRGDGVVQVMGTLLQRLKELDKDPDTRVIVLSGAGRAFAAGADIRELSQCKSYTQAYQERLLEDWEGVACMHKPILAAVNGPALGGGLELVLACDMAIAAEQAVFGLPEITLGLIPGGGGTQRLARRIGKARTMELILTGDKLSAWEAERVGIVSRVVKADMLVPMALDVAQKIATYSAPVIAKAKETVNAAYEMPLKAGLRFEKREFWSCFALQDSQEGLNAFLEKRTPRFTHQ